MVIASHLEAVLARPNCLRAPISGKRFQRRGRSGQESPDRFLGIIGILLYPPSGVTRQKLIQLRRNCNLKA